MKNGLHLNNILNLLNYLILLYLLNKYYKNNFLFIVFVKRNVLQPAM